VYFPAALPPGGADGSDKANPGEGRGTGETTNSDATTAARAASDAGG